LDYDEPWTQYIVIMNSWVELRPRKPEGNPQHMHLYYSQQGKRDALEL
jgi:hypothetical protein